MNETKTLEDTMVAAINGSLFYQVLALAGAMSVLYAFIIASSHKGPWPKWAGPIVAAILLVCGGYTVWTRNHGGQLLVCIAGVLACSTYGVHEFNKTRKAPGHWPKWFIIPVVGSGMSLIAYMVWSLFYSMFHAVLANHPGTAGVFATIVAALCLAGPLTSIGEWAKTLTHGAPPKGKNAVVNVHEFLLKELRWAPFKLLSGLAGVAAIIGVIGLTIFLGGHPDILIVVVGAAGAIGLGVYSAIAGEPKKAEEAPKHKKH